MKLTTNQINEFNERGFLLLENLIPEEVIDHLSKTVEKLETKEYPGHVFEAHGKGFRALHGCHLYDKTFNGLIRSPELLDTAKKLLNDDVYVHQLKVNLKKPFNGEQWPWHQDYIYWRNKDGIPKDSIISVMLFIDDINEFNGPLFIIPKSHAVGCIDSGNRDVTNGGWDQDVSADLTYQVENKLVDELIKKEGIFSAKGKKGTVLWFHGNIIHASPPNISPYKRRVGIITYNPVSNASTISGTQPRPEFICGTDTRPLQSIELLPT